MERLFFLVTLVATNVLAQTALQLVNDPASSTPPATAARNEVAGYSLDGSYWTDGTNLYFQTILKVPISVAVKDTIFQTYVQFNDTVNSNSVKTWDIGTCQTAFPGLANLQLTTFSAMDFQTKAGAELFTLTSGYNGLNTTLVYDTT